MDPYRPLYHFLPPQNWMNDPNGLIQWNGTYHLFYQYNPNGAYWGNMHWGHAASTDLVHWKHLPIALAPTEGEPDSGGCYTGSAVDWNRKPTLVYTGWTPERETVMVAVSNDDLLTFEKIAANPVISGPPEGLDLVGFRDPYVWRQDDIYLMVLGAGIRGVGGAALLYSSANLTDWTYLGPLYVGDRTDRQPLPTGEMWECPNFFELGDRHVLIVSKEDVNPTRNLVPLYFLGEFHDFHFSPELAARLDGGDVFCYAPQTFLDESGRRIMFGWAREARSAETQIEAGWAGVMTLPRLLEWSPEGWMSISPAPEVNRLRGEAHHWKNIQIEADQPLALQDFSGDCLELDLTFQFNQPAAEEGGAVGVLVRRSPGGEEQTEIRYEMARGLLIVDTLRSSLSAEADHNHHSIELDLTGYDHLSLRIFLDKSILEVYANDRVVITTRIYPTRPDSQGFMLFSREHPAQVAQMQGWQMKPI